LPSFRDAFLRSFSNRVFSPAVAEAVTEELLLKLSRRS
jgi:hypothetical protein